MNREEFIRTRRQICEERMDTLFAPVYDDHWGGETSPSHQEMLGRFLASCPANPFILDAACGTGKYWETLLANGCRVTGIDQSEQMLDRAQQKHPAVPVRKLGLQDLDDRGLYDGVACIDAMENVCPEDWLPVLRNFQRALRPHGLLYLTVELEAPDFLRAELERGRSEGLPLVEGESVLEGGYHYYPALTQVQAWFEEAGFQILDTMEGDEYYHVLADKSAATKSTADAPHRTHLRGV
jgi:2-polyprenyl-3-methyl-5-hydroxy-6-metoxy-1,4-benzoquinol methylase